MIASMTAAEFAKDFMACDSFKVLILESQKTKAVTPESVLRYMHLIAGGYGIVLTEEDDFDYRSVFGQHLVASAA